MPLAAARLDAPSAPGVGVGVDLRALRKSQGLTLTDLASRVGRSPAWLSQVERGLSEPSIGDLRRLAAALGITLSFFFAHGDGPAAERGRIVRAGQRRSLGDKEDGLTEELLSPDLAGDFLAVRSVFQPHTEAEAEVRRDTDELGYVVSGRLELWIAGTRYDLGPGDSFRIRREPSRWRNPGDEPAVAVWIISPPVY